MFVVKVLSVILVSYLHFAGTQTYQRNIPYPYNYQQPPIQHPFYYPQNYPAFSQFNTNPYPIGVTQKPQIDPYRNIPTEIIDVDENVIVPEPRAPDGFSSSKPEIKKKPKEIFRPVVVEKTSYSSNNANKSKTIHIIESKPIQTVIRRVITSNGKDGKNVINIHLVNGVEITSERSNRPQSEPSHNYDNKIKDDEDDEEEEITNEDDDKDPKPIDSWIFG